MEGEQQSEAMISRFLSCLCLLDTLVTPVYVVLTLVALSSLAVPFLQDLASHGKTRDTVSTSASIQQQHGCRSSVDFFPSPVRRLSHGEVFLVKKKFFLHFYVCGLLSFAVLYVGASFAAPTMDGNPSLSHSTTLVLLVIHLSRRLYECVNVHRWTSQSKMHLAGYFVGMLHYVFLPFVFISVPCSHRNNDKEDTPVSSLYSRDSESSSSQWIIIAAASLFCLWAQYQQYRHHCLLARLRSPNSIDNNTSKSNAKTVYSLPVGGWFRFVTCPHYLAEILIYVAFAILLEMQVQIRRDDSHSVRTNRFRYFFLLAWVATNLTVSALVNHDWYTKQFPNHTMLGRKAIVPLIL